MTGTDERGVRKREKEGERGVKGEGIAPSGGLMERYSGALKPLVGEKYLDRSLVLLCSLLAATSPRSSLPSALRGGLRAHAPPTV